jgi:hypothetical protein
MLEQRVLLLRPPDPSGRRLITDPATGAPLGFARRHCPTGSRWWQRLRPVLAVHEHEDEPLVFTVRRCWTLLPVREVREAEGRRIGLLQGTLIQDGFGQNLAVRLWGPDRKRTVYRGPDGLDLAELAPGASGLCLTFPEALDSDPFLKMLLLAAALSLEETRRGRFGLVG